MVANVSVHILPRAPKSALLDVVAEALVADPSASLAEVAAAAGIGRTTLHKQYATRDDLMRAVAHRAIDLWSAAIDSVVDGADGGLRSLIEAMIPIGPQLAFLWRNPMFEHVPEIVDRWTAVEERGKHVVDRAQANGVIAAEVPKWWLLQSLYSVIYVASESVRSGHLAPRDAPRLVLSTYLSGLGSERPEVTA